MEGMVTVMHGAGIVTMDAERRIYQNGALVVRDSEILAVGQSSSVLEQYRSVAHEVIDLKGHWILPGLINTHVHTSQQLGRGIADDVDLLTWLHHRIFPYESNMTEEDSFISTMLCGIELIHSGVTCFAEAGGQHVAGMARAVEKLGLRACLAKSTMDTGDGLPTRWAADDAETCMKLHGLREFSMDFLCKVCIIGNNDTFGSGLKGQNLHVSKENDSQERVRVHSIQVQEELFKKFDGTADGRIHVWFGLRQILNATDDLLLRTKDLALQYKTGIHMHVAEIPFENEWVAKTRNVEHGTVTFLNQIGLLNNNLLAAHSVWVTDSEVDMMAHKGVKVSHCPASNMKMLGFAPISDMLSKGICVSLGTDGAPSNNRMSLVDEMYLASLINKGKVVFSQGMTDPTALPAETILEMATINGAKSVLWDSKIGSLEAGKKADFLIVDPEKWTMLPLHDPISSFVYCMRTENIASVMCNGQWLMRDRKILTVDEEEVLSKAKTAAADLMRRANIQLPKRGNIIV